MSQEKVDRYKQEKANRKKQAAKKKQQKMLKYIGGILGSILLIAVIILSAKQLKGDFTEEESTTYSEEYLEQIRDLFSTEGEEETSTSAK